MTKPTTPYSGQLSRLQKIGFGAGDVAVNISMMSISLLLTYFYTDVFRLRAEDMALLFLIVRLLDAVTDPMMGWITDKIQTRRGRYRPWILGAAIPFGLSVYLVFANPQLDYSQRLTWAYASYIFNTLMFTMVTIPYISLIGAISDSPKERLSANAYRFVMAKGAVLFVTSCVTALATWLGDGEKAQGFGAAMMLMAALSTVALLFCYRTTEERVAVEVCTTPIGEQVKNLFKNDQWRVLAVACVMVMTGYLVRGSIAFHYATYYLAIDGGFLFALFMSMWAVGGISATFASAWLTARYCKVKVFRYSLFLATLSGVAMYFGVPQGAWLAGIVGYFLLCFFSDINTPIFWASIAEVVDYGEHKTGTRVSGLTFGSISFLQKLGMGVAGFMVGILLAFFQYQPGGQQSEFTLMGISLMMSLIPAALFLVTGLVMIKFRISETFYQDTIQSSIRVGTES